MEIKEEFLDIKITCPLTGKDRWVRFIETELYPYIFKIYPDIFKTEIKNDIFTNSNGKSGNNNGSASV